MTQTIKKPWGFEYLLFENNNVAIWHLFIDAYQQTSMHCHPNKKTGLIVLDGAAKISFLDGEHKLFYGEKIMIRNGVFHRTTSMTPYPLQLFEIENPVNKQDIVRLDDLYGRTHSDYMGDSSINTIPFDIYSNNFIGKCAISYTTLNNDYFEYNNDLFDNFIITDGSVQSDNYVVAGPGDIISYKNLKRLYQRFQSNFNINGIAVKVK